MKPSIKLAVSLAANLILIITLVMVWFHTALQAHYYQTFTGFVVRLSVEGIDHGNAAGVKEALKRLPFHPEYSDLVTAVKALEFPENAAADPHKRESGMISAPPQR